ncbi:MAG: cupin domain-containing protein [Bacteriovoracales bacterium]|nr:cupin domain-containing protein [Bacteriovoracales bacterium]
MSSTSKHSAIKHYKEIQNDDSRYFPNSDERTSIGSSFGEAFGFKKLGIYHDLLPPGRRTSYPHAESDEEEFIFVIEGTPDVWINGHLHPLKPGDGVGFPCGTGICHTFINNTDNTVRLLVVGEKTKATNKFFFPLNPELKERNKNRWWNDAPPHDLGPHDGLPDAIRKK